MMYLTGRRALNTGLLIGLFALLSFTACDRQEAGDDESAPFTAVDSREGVSKPALAIVKSEVLPTHPARIISLAPNVTEILFALGAGERVVGATRYCDYPAEANAIPRVGGMLDPDFEAMMAARPDLVTGVMDGSDQRLVARLDQANIPYIFFKMDTLNETYAGIREIGRVIGLDQKGESAARELEDRLTTLSLSYKKALQNRSTPLKVLLVYDHQPVVVAGPGTFGHELISLAGARNALDDDAKSYPVLDIEMVMRLNPDVIVDATLSRSSEEVEHFWKRYPSLKAVSEGGIARFGDPLLMRPGPRLPLALGLIGDALTP